MAELENGEDRITAARALLELLTVGWGVEVETFSVERTNERKGVRDPRPYDNTYRASQLDAKTRITIQVEAPDDSTEQFSQLAKLAAALERQVRDRAVAAKLKRTEDALKEAVKNHYQAKKEAGLLWD
jgi:hypothetical protein